jgi:hypothetical protein
MHICGRIESTMKLRRQHVRPRPLTGELSRDWYNALWALTLSSNCQKKQKKTNLTCAEETRLTRHHSQNVPSSPTVETARREKLRQETTMQDTTRHVTTRHNRKRRGVVGCDRSRQDKTACNRTGQDSMRQDRTRQGETRQWQGGARQGKARKGFTPYPYRYN